VGHWAAAPRLRIGIGLGAVALTLTGCGSNFNAQSQQEYQPAVGLTDRTGQVYAVDALVVTDGHGDGTLVAALINQAHKTDSLRAVSAVTDQGTKLHVAPLPANGLRLPYQQSVQLANSGAVRVQGSALQAGSVVHLTFTFQQAAPVRVDAPVVNDSSTYSSVPVGPATRGTAPSP
jgi:copper(I)-binding protein